MPASRISGYCRTHLISFYKNRKNRKGPASDLISNGSRVSIAIQLKQLIAPVSACPFQIKHPIFQTEQLHPPINKRLPFELK